MSIKKLTGYIGEANISEELDDETLTAIGARVHRQYSEDLDTMSDWMQSVENGVDLMKQEWESKSTPWEGASNYKDPLLTQASIQFGDKAVLELLRGKDLISSEVVGRDPQGEKKARSERVVEVMNYQVNHGMKRWRKKQERLFYTLPNIGCAFKKMVYDPVEEVTESYIIQYPDFVVNQATDDMDDCRSFSQVLDFTRNDINEKVRSGLWADIEQDVASDNDKQGDKGGNEAEGVIYSMDNPESFIEQQTFYDIDGDGYEEPYIVTIHKSSRKVVRVVPRYDERSIIVRVDGEAMPLPEAMQRREEAEKQSFGGERILALMNLTPPEVNPDEMELLKIVPFQHITKYGFIPASDGTFLDLGYFHLLGAITQAINTSTNQLTDRATLNNIGGGLLSKEFRKSMGISRLKTGEYIKTEVPADKFQKGVLPNPTGEPSPTLMALNEQMRMKGGEVLATSDIGNQVTAQTAPMTALAIIQEGMISTSALFKRILDAESNEFQILFRINGRTFDDLKYQTILDDPTANAQADFNAEGIDIIPTANAEMSSKMQRIQVAGLEMDVFDRVLQTGGNPVPIIKNYFESIGSTIMDQIYPDEGSMSPAELEQMKKMQEGQDLQNQIQQQQLQILQREQDRLDADTQAKIEKVGTEIEKLQADVIKTLADAAKSGEEAETESLNNQISIYTQQMRMRTDELQSIGRTVNKPPMEFDYDPMSGEIVQRG
jgi:chaperonin GroES